MRWRPIRDEPPPSPENDGSHEHGDRVPIGKRLESLRQHENQEERQIEAERDRCDRTGASAFGFVGRCRSTTRSSAFRPSGRQECLSSSDAGWRDAGSPWAISASSTELALPCSWVLSMSSKSRVGILGTGVSMRGSAQRVSSDRPHRMGSGRALLRYVRGLGFFHDVLPSEIFE